MCARARVCVCILRRMRLMDGCDCSGPRVTPCRYHFCSEREERSRDERGCASSQFGSVTFSVIQHTGTIFAVGVSSCLLSYNRGETRGAAPKLTPRITTRFPRFRSGLHFAENHCRLQDSFVAWVCFPFSSGFWPPRMRTPTVRCLISCDLSDSDVCVCDTPA